MIRSCFGGLHENFVVSGSEDARIYIWNRETTELVAAISGHEATVNCISWNPQNLYMFASASDDRGRLHRI